MSRDLYTCFVSREMPKRSRGRSTKSIKVAEFTVELDLDEEATRAALRGVLHRAIEGAGGWSSDDVAWRLDVLGRAAGSIYSLREERTGDVFCVYQGKAARSCGATRRWPRLSLDQVWR